MAGLRLGIPPKIVTKEMEPCATKVSLGLLINTVTPCAPNKVIDHALVVKITRFMPVLAGSWFAPNAVKLT